MSYSLKIEIAPTQLFWLRANGYNLRIARKTNDIYTVIWETKDVARNVELSWQEEFQTFWTTKFSEGLSVESRCNPVAVGYGQNVNIKENTSMEPATGAIDQSGKFTVVNNSHPVNMGLSVKLDGEWKSCFISTDKVDPGKTITIAPTIVLKVWLGHNVPSESRGIEIEGASIEVTYSGTKQNTISYDGTEGGNGEWKLGKL